jgi:hypothetical protein
VDVVYCRDWAALEELAFAGSVPGGAQGHRLRPFTAYLGCG